MNNVINKCVKMVSCCFYGLIYLFNRLVECCSKGKPRAKAQENDFQKKPDLFSREANQADIDLDVKQANEWIRKMKKVVGDAIKHREAKIILIGNGHTEEATTFELDVAKRAMKKEVINIAESVLNRKESLMARARLCGYLDSGYYFGMEDPLVNHFVDLVYRYAPIYMGLKYSEKINSNALESVEEHQIEILGSFYFENSCKTL